LYILVIKCSPNIGRPAESPCNAGFLFGEISLVLPLKTIYNTKYICEGEHNMATILAYDNLEGRNTREVLRRLNTRDMDRLRDEVDLYWKVMEQQDDPEYTQIWNTPSKAMPKKTLIAGKKYALQSPREYMEGFREKINRQRGTDLSPRQCEGFTNFNSWFSQEFGTQKMVFVDKNTLFDQPELSKLLDNL
jgi:hypothetical protein